LLELLTVLLLQMVCDVHVLLVKVIRDADAQLLAVQCPNYSTIGSVAARRAASTAGFAAGCAHGGGRKRAKKEGGAACAAPGEITFKP
jgi:hypothetical protein